MARNIFRLEAIVDILTGKAVDQLKRLDKEAQKAADSLAGRFQIMSTAALRFAGPAVLGALSAALIKTAYDAVKFGNELHDAMKRFQVATGAGTAEAKRFQDALLGLHRVNTDSIDELAQSLQVIRREFGNLGNELPRVTQHFLDFSKVTGQTTADAVDVVKETLDAYGLSVEHVEPLLDRLARAQQLTGANAGELAHQLSAAQPIFQALGFSIDESIALLAMFEDQGVGAEVTLTGLRNVLKAVNETTDKQTAAFKTLGIEVDSFGRPVEGARVVLDRLLQMLASGHLNAEQMGAVLDLVGSRAGGGFARGLRSGEDAFKSMMAQIEGSAGTIAKANEEFDKQFGERWELLKRKHFDPNISAMGQSWVWFLNTALTVLDQVVTGIEDMGYVLAGMASTASATFSSVVTGVQEMWLGLVKMVKTNIANMIDEVLALLERLPTAVQEKLGDTQKNLSSLSGRLRSEGRGGENFLQRGFSGAVQGVKDFFTGKAFDVGKAEIPIEPTDVKPQLKVDTNAFKQRPTAPLPAPNVDEKAAAKEARKAADDILDHWRHTMDRRRELHTLTTEQEIAELEKVLKTHEVVLNGRTQKLSLTVQQERELELDLAKLKGKLLEDQEKERKRADDEAKRRTEQRKKLEADLQVEIVRASQGETAGKIAELDRQRAEHLKLATDKAQVEAWYQTQRKKIEDDANKEILDKRKTASDQMKDAVLQAQGKEREIAVRGIEEVVRKAREARVAEIEIAEFVAAKKKELLDKEVADEKAARDSLLGKGQDPDRPAVLTMEEALKTPESTFKGFGSKKKGKSGDLSDAEVDSRLGALVGGGAGAPEAGQLSRHFDRFGGFEQSGIELTSEQLAARQGRFSQVAQDRLAQFGGTPGIVPDLSAVADDKLAAAATSPFRGKDGKLPGKETADAAAVTPEPGKVVHEVRVSGKLDVAGRIEQIEGDLSGPTVNGMLSDIAFAGRMLGTKAVR